MTRIYRLSAFSFEKIAPKEKAPQKEKGRLRSRRAGATTRGEPLLKKWTKQSLS